MRKSTYGKELTYFWTGYATHEVASMREVPSTLKISDEEKSRLEKAFAESKAKNPAFFDGLKWRYEGHEKVRGGVDFLVSSTSYLPHNILRNEAHPVSYTTTFKQSLLPVSTAVSEEGGRFESHYPNPFSINALQITDDNYILIGVKGGISDQKGLGVMGAGFIDREENLPPKNLFLETIRECREETSYKNNTAPTERDIGSLMALGTIFGSNHDTTTCVYVPLRATKDEVDIGNKEHTDLWFLPTDIKSLEDFLNEGGMKQAKSVDHLIGCIELYRDIKKRRGYWR